MQTNTPLPEQAEMLRIYLLGSIHGALLRVAEDKFIPPSTVDKVKDSVVLITKSGTKIEFTARVLDVGK